MMKKVFTIFALLLFSSSFLALGTSAATPDYKSARNQFKSSVSAFKKAQEECIKAKGEVKGSQIEVKNEKIKEFLTKATDLAIKYLKTSRKKVETVSGVTEADKLTYLAQIDNHISFFTQKEIEIQTLAEAEKLTEISKEMKEYWSKARLDVRHILQKILTSKAENILSKLIRIQAKLKQIIELKRQEEQKIANLEHLLLEYKNNLEKAQEIYQTTNESDTISDTALLNVCLEKESEKIKEAEHYLQLAYKNLQEIVTELE